MLPIVELKTATLDYGIPGVSSTHMLLLFLMMFSISMIPYLFLYISLRDEKVKASTSLRPSPGFGFSRVIAWVHAHRHPALLHH